MQIILERYAKAETSAMANYEITSKANPSLSEAKKTCMAGNRPQGVQPCLPKRHCRQGN
jgi:hypothetical protein